MNSLYQYSNKASEIEIKIKVLHPIKVLYIWIEIYTHKRNYIQFTYVNTILQKTW